MFSTDSSIIIYDKADVEDNEGKFSEESFEIPPDLEIDCQTYLGGSQCFRVEEVEVYQVIV